MQRDKGMLRSLTRTLEFIEYVDVFKNKEGDIATIWWCSMDKTVSEAYISDLITAFHMR